jgi:hypothetical protein
MIVTFDGFKEKQKEVDEYKKSILKLIDEFITTDEYFKKNHTTMGVSQLLSPYKYSTDFFIDNQRRGDFVVDYCWGTFSKTDQIHFSGLEYKRLQDFMKEPELYRNNRKYNI